MVILPLTGAGMGRQRPTSERRGVPTAKRTSTEFMKHGFLPQRASVAVEAAKRKRKHGGDRRDPHVELGLTEENAVQKATKMYYEVARQKFMEDRGLKSLEIGADRLDAELVG